MKKFGILLKKEIKEIMTVGTIISILLSGAIFMVLSQFMDNIQDQYNVSYSELAVCDRDNSELSGDVIAHLNSTGIFQVVPVDGATDDEAYAKAKEMGHDGLLVIEKGFAEGIASQTAQKIKIMSEMKSVSPTSVTSEHIYEMVVSEINTYLSDGFISAGSEGQDLAFIKNPVTTDYWSVVSGKSANVSNSVLMSKMMMQNMMIPIIIFILLTFATQSVISTIANEKGDKTLETLLSTPVSRLSILFSKMLSSALMALLMAAAYMFGFSFYMSSITGGAAVGTEAAGSAIAALGLTLSPFDYVLIGLQVFATILIALSIAMILGVLSDDVKSAQAAIAPLMFLMLIPYFISIMADINSLPMVVRLIVYLIPFTHTFGAIPNLMFGNQTIFFIGLAYQVVLLAVCLFITCRIFASDKILTMKLKRKSGLKKKKAIAE